MEWIEELEETNYIQISLGFHSIKTTPYGLRNWNRPTHLHFRKKCKSLLDNTTVFSRDSSAAWWILWRQTASISYLLFANDVGHTMLFVSAALRTICELNCSILEARTPVFTVLQSLHKIEWHQSLLSQHFPSVSYCGKIRVLKHLTSHWSTWNNTQRKTNLFNLPFLIYSCLLKHQLLNNIGL